jgi:glycosyltransferase involved in cell wall biosynthesis
LNTKPKILVIVPSYNEKQNIKDTIISIREKIDSDNILVIDDGSTDGSFKIIDNLKVNVLKNQKNIGRNRSIIRGFEWGLSKGYTMFITIDADGQHSASEIPRMIKYSAAKNIDCLIMSRFKHRRDLLLIPKFDAFGILVSSFFVSIASRARITDPTTGFIAFSKRAATCLVKYGELLHRIASDNTWAIVQYPLFTMFRLTISEVPTDYKPRISGHRKMFAPLKQFLYPAWLFRSYLGITLFLHFINCKHN